MKRTISLIIICLLALTLAGCSQSGNTGSSETKQTAAADVLSGEVSLTQALDRSGTQVWYTLDNFDGRLSKVVAVYAFSDGKMVQYDLYDLQKKSLSSDLGTLEDYYELSPDDAVALAKQKYEAMYEEYYGRLDKEIDKIDVEAEEYEGEYIKDANEQFEAITSVRDQIRSEGMAEKTPAPYTILGTLDSSGNGIEIEHIKGTRTTDNTYTGIIARDAMYGMELYELVPGTSADIYIPCNKASVIMEVYDTYYGGYLCEIEGRTKYNLVTKCAPDTVFTLDTKDAKGMEISK